MICPHCGNQLADYTRFCGKCGGEIPVSEIVPVATAAQQANQADALLGSTLEGKYRIEAKLGAGGMGAVYRATRLMIGDLVAIKVLHAEQVADPQAIERFRREAQAAARLKHPNAVSIYDFGVSSEGLVYLVMELVEGSSLRRIIKEQGPLTPTAAAEVMTQVCAALDEAHRQNVIHRDLKPDNIIVNATGSGLRVKVLDFGIAKMRDLTASNLTLTGSVMGTPYYMSPEHCMGEEIDGRSDIYSLGIVLFEMLAGVVPFNSPTSTAVIVAHVNQAPPSLRALNANISPAVEAVVMHALEKRREARPQTAVQLAQELIAAVQGRPLTPHSGSIPVSTFNSTPASTTPTANPVAGAGLAPTMQMKITSVISGARTAAPAKNRLPLKLWVAVGTMMAVVIIGLLIWASQTSSPTNEQASQTQPTGQDANAPSLTAGMKEQLAAQKAGPRDVRAYCAVHENYEPGEQSEDELPAEVKAAGKAAGANYWWRCASGKVMVCDAGASGRACVKTEPADARRMQAFRKFCRESPNSDYIVGSLISGLASSWRCKGTTPVMTGTRPVDSQGYFTDTWRMLK